MSNYRDPTHLTAADFDLNADPSITGTKIAQFIRTKAYGVDVRESLAQWVEVNLAVLRYINDDETEFKIELQNKQEGVEARQTEVEQTMSDVLDKFKKVIVNATKDSETILSRDSSHFGNFTVLDDRLEYMESLLAAYVPAGFNVTIKHNQNRQPKVVVHYYEYAIGTETDGLGTGPYGLGESAVQTIPAKVDYPDDDTCIVHLPLSYALTGVVTYKAGYWYLIDGYKTLRFDLGDDIDDGKATAGNGSNQTSTNSSGAGDDSGTGTNTTIPEIKNLRVTPIDDKTDRLDWDTTEKTEE